MNHLVNNNINFLFNICSASIVRRGHEHPDTILYWPAAGVMDPLMTPDVVSTQSGSPLSVLLTTSAIPDHPLIKSLIKSRVCNHVGYIAQRMGYTQHAITPHLYI